MYIYIYIYQYVDPKYTDRVLNTVVERNNNNNNESNFGYFIENLITTNLFRMAGQACHTHQVIIASDIKSLRNLILYYIT